MQHISFLISVTDYAADNKLTSNQEQLRNRNDDKCADFNLFIEFYRSYYLMKKTAEKLISKNEMNWSIDNSGFLTIESLGKIPAKNLG